MRLLRIVRSVEVETRRTLKKSLVLIAATSRAPNRFFVAKELFLFRIPTTVSAGARLFPSYITCGVLVRSTNYMKNSLAYVYVGTKTMSTTRQMVYSQQRNMRAFSFSEHCLAGSRSAAFKEQHGCPQ